MGHLEPKDRVRTDLASRERHLLENIARLASGSLDLRDLDVLKSGLLQLSLDHAGRFPQKAWAQVSDRQGAA